MSGRIQVQKNICPFTKLPLHRRQLIKLTPHNVEVHIDNITNWECLSEKGVREKTLKAAAAYVAVHPY